MVAVMAFGAAAGEAAQPGPPPRSKRAPKAEDTTVRIGSVPPGAMVMLCAGEDFQERAAVPMGKTPLLHLLPLSERPVTVRITKAGYAVWNGRLSRTAPEIQADLAPLTEAQKQELGWFASPPCPRLTVVPVRLGFSNVELNITGLMWSE
jgi:hypothetical protein